ncbi:alpha/beta hydrolase [Ideonella sp. TBM-1]|uniref:Alpha/beta hydrolase n=1 Tax=Ideonella livida TaxID=2707176 RepID=A0A7C9PHZ8_9BURK|nr:alpha/beta hydrolase [Ideonella livida]
MSAPELQLRFDASRFTPMTVQVNGLALAVRAYEGLPTVTRPVEPAYQVLNLYIPEAYFQGGAVGRYTAQTAPIFLPNAVGGYLPARPGTPAGRSGPPPGAASAPGGPPTGGPPGAGPGGNGPSTIAQALAHGYVVASPGVRGRTLRATDGTWTGKAPAALVDLKAAVRWLHFNAGRLPGGRADRIVSNGTSAGGALSALLGASGGSMARQAELQAAVQAELQALGAAPAPDPIFAVSAYCPITHLAHADEAYEWQFQGVHDYRRIDITMLDHAVQRREVPGTLSPAQQALSAELAAAFPAHVNGLGLKDEAGRPLTLAADGSGPLRDAVVAQVLASAQRALATGQSLAGRTWLTVEGGRVTGLDWEAYRRALGRLKVTPAFDDVALGSGENQLFGDARTDKRHFTAWALARSTVPGATAADAATVDRMDAVVQLLRSDAGSVPAPHWRIRHGTQDKDTALAVPVLLAAAARHRGLSVDLALSWDRPHSGDYDLPELFDWIDRTVAAAR